MFSVWVLRLGLGNPLVAEMFGSLGNQGLGQHNLTQYCSLEAGQLPLFPRPLKKNKISRTSREKPASHFENEVPLQSSAKD